jgi:hypothetical protein
MIVQGSRVICITLNDGEIDDFLNILKKITDRKPGFLQLHLTEGEEMLITGMQSQLIDDENSD